jgi:ZIP family zinc transporter
MLELIAASSATVIACGLGAIPVFALNEPSRQVQAAMLGGAAGVMAVAAVAGLLIPGLDEGRDLEVWIGVIVGVGFMFAVRRRLDRSEHIASRAGRTSALVFIVLLVHSLPEGFAIGTAYASDSAELGLFVVIAIAIQNIPEGTSGAIPLARLGASPSRQFWAATASSLPQPIGAVIAYEMVQEVTSLLPLSFGFAAGAMAAVVAFQLLPDARELDARPALWGTVGGIAAMLALSLALGTPT